MKTCKKRLFRHNEQECIVDIDIEEQETNYVVSYKYSHDNEAHPFYKCCPPGIKKKFEREHEYGDNIFKNDLSKIIIDFMVNDKDIHKPTEITSDNILRYREKTIVFKHPESWISSECKYTLSVIERDNTIGIYANWDTFNDLHPQYYPNFCEESCRKYSLISKNEFTETLINYLMMDEDILGNITGFSTALHYKSIIIRNIIPALYEKEDSLRTIMTCIIPALWD